MTSADRIRVKHNIDQAAAAREGRVAVHISESLRNALDMIDAQPAAVLKVLIEHGKRLQQSGNAPKHRHKVRAVIIEYLEERANEAVERERRLACAITGEDPPDE